MSTRDLGEKIAISVGTAIPLEERVLVETPPVKEIWINTQTLVRNYYSSYENAHTLPMDEFITGATEEAGIIKALLEGTVRVRLYQTDYERLASYLPLAKIKQPRTERQKHYATIERMALRAMRSQPDLQVIQCKVKLPGSANAVWILTHHPLDLLSRYEFNELTLLSSSTGELLRPTQWARKLSDRKEVHRLPFNALTLQVMGDKAKQFYVHSNRYSNALLAVAADGKWKPTTTRDKVLYDLNKMTDHDIRDAFKAMLKTTLP